MHCALANVRVIRAGVVEVMMMMLQDGKIWFSHTETFLGMQNILIPNA